MANLEAAKKTMNKAGKAGATQEEEKNLNEWLGKVDEMQTAVKYLLSDDYTDTAEEQEEKSKPTEKEEPTDDYKKKRYTSDYTRFENEDFVKEMEPRKKEASPVVATTRPSTDDPKKLTEYLCKKESLTYKEKGNAAFKSGNYTEAEHLYSSGITLDSTNHTTRNNRAQARLKLRDWKGTLDDCTVVLAHDPLNIKAIKRRAVALMGLRQSGKALDDIAQAIKYEGSTKELRLLRATATSEAAEEAKVIGADPTVLNEVTAFLTTTTSLMDRLRVHGPAKPVEEDDDTLFKLCTALRDMRGKIQTCDAAKIHFRWEGGITAIISFIKDFKTGLSKAPADDGPSEWDVLPILLYDTLHDVFTVEYNMAHSVAEGPLCSVLVPQLVATCDGSKLASVASLRLLVRITEEPDVRSEMRKHLSPQELMNLPHHVKEGDDGVLSLLLQLVDNLLKSEVWCDDLSSQPLPAYILPLMHHKRSRAIRDAAGAAVMRLTTDAKFRKYLTETNLSLPLKSSSWGALTTKSQSVLHYLTEYLKEEAATLQSPFAVEAILASLCNCMVENDKGILAVLAEPENIAPCLALLKSDVAGHANIRARALAYIAKSISVKKVHGYLKGEGGVELLLKYIKLPKEEQDREYTRLCQENSVSALGAMLVAEDGDMDGEVDEFTELILSTEPVVESLKKYKELGSVLGSCLEGADRVCGNACLILSVLFKRPEWIDALSKQGGMVIPLLDVIKKKRSEQRDEEEHCRLTNTPVPLFSLNGQAQKNAAISLARLAKNPANIAVLRENQGIDILSTTLKYTSNQAG